MANKHDSTIEKQRADVPEGAEETSSRRTFLPPTCICETDDSIIVMADMPAVRAEDVDVTLENRALTIHGRVRDEETEGTALAYAEYDTGDYHREFSVSTQVDADNIQASLDRGVLTLTLPKAKPAHKRIKVDAGG